MAREHQDRQNHQETEALGERRQAMPDRSLIEGAATFFRAMADPTRMRLLVALAQEPTCVGDLCVLLQLEQSAVSHQLRFLREANLVAAIRSGRHVVYSLQDDHVAGLVREAVAHAGHLDSSSSQRS